MSAANAGYVELVYTVTPDGADAVENNVFRDQLLTYFPELRSDAKVNKKLERLKYKETDLTTDENLMEFENSWFTVNAMAGAIFMKKFEIGVSARLTGSFSSMIGINAKPSIYLVKLGYRF